MRYRILVVAMLAATACQPVVKPALWTFKSSASTADYMPYLQPGTASLTGQAFLMTRGGEAKKAGGREVVLDPATTYALEWYHQAGKSYRRYNDLPPDTMFRKARRVVTADADGRFRFGQLPAGLYIVRTVITWQTGSGIVSEMYPEGGVLADTVSIATGESREVILNKMAQ